MPNSTSDRLPTTRAGALWAFLGLSIVAGLLVALGVTPAVAVTSFAAQSGINAFDNLPTYLKIQPLDQRSTIYAEKGGQEVPIATFYAQNRQDVGWTGVTSLVKQAAIDTEDPHFYEEGGVDVTGTIRGALSTALGHDTQGGSSITQQYVKNVLVQRCDAEYINQGATKAVTQAEQEKYENCYADAAGTTIDRKLKEIRYAIGVNKTYTKRQVLMGYLNIAGFGGQVYGIQAAAEYYFDVPATQLNLPESATLVAILNNPANLRIDIPSSKENGQANGYKLTLDRRNYVLQRMEIHHSITAAQYQAAVKTPITPKITPEQSGCGTAAQYDAAFFCDYVEDEFKYSSAFGKTEDDRLALFDRGGLNIYSTLNLDLQNTAQAAVSNYIPASSSNPNYVLGASDVSMEVGTGRIVTMVENKGYNDTSTPNPDTTAVNYNTDYAYGGSNGFQTGSSFKAYDLIAWLQAGYAIDDVINASQHAYNNTDFTNSCDPTTSSPWYITNDEGDEGGNMTVLAATENSVNTAFAKMATKLDLCNILNAAKSLDVHPANPAANPWVETPSLILGTNYISPLTMATAYAGIANNGVVCTPIAIDKVVTNAGASIPTPKTSCHQGISSAVAAGVVYALEHVMTNGTATSANPFDGVPIMGKTGTSDNSVQNWLVTSTTKVANAVWVGNVKGQVAMRSQYFRGINGGNVKFSIDRPILAALDKTYGGSQFTAPPSSEITGGPSDPLYVAPAPTPSPTPAPTPTQTTPSTPVPTDPASPGTGGNGTGGNGAGGTGGAGGAGTGG